MRAVSRCTERKVILVYHAIFTAYGFWLPNDPRGSWSTFVASWELLLAGGKATTTDERRSVAHVEHDRQKRLEAKRALNYTPVEFTSEQALVRLQRIRRRHRRRRVHRPRLLDPSESRPHGRRPPRSRHRAGRRAFKSAATRQLDADGMHPFAGTSKRDGTRQSPWAERCWKVFLNSPLDVSRAVDYVEQNPVKEGKRRQPWSFVTALRQ